MSSDSINRGRERSRRRYLIRLFRKWTPSVRTTERVGGMLTVILATVAFAFVLLYWFQRHGYAVGAYEGFLAGGAMLDTLLGTNLFRHPPIWYSVASAILAGITVPLVGTFLVHREQALIGETLAHTAFVGVAVGIVVSGLTGWTIPYELSALVVSVVGALGLQWFTQQTDAHGDVPLAIVLTVSFAIGTLLITYADGRMAVPVDIEQFLFGSTAIVTETGARMMAGIALFVWTTVAIFYQQLLYTTFDSQAAAASGIDVAGFNRLLIVLTAAVIVGAMQVLGVILVTGLLVVPAAAASQVAGDFRELVLLSVVFGELSVAIGLFISLITGLPSGGLIIVVAIVVYLLALARSDQPPKSIDVK